MHRRTAKIIVVAILACIVIVAIGAAILGLIGLLSSGPENLAVLLQKMAEVIDTARRAAAVDPQLAARRADRPPGDGRGVAARERRAAALIGQDVWRGLSTS